MCVVAGRASEDREVWLFLDGVEGECGADSAYVILPSEAIEVLEDARVPGDTDVKLSGTVLPAGADACAGRVYSHCVLVRRKACKCNGCK